MMQFESNTQQYLVISGVAGVSNEDVTQLIHLCMDICLQDNPGVFVGLRIDDDTLRATAKMLKRWFEQTIVVRTELRSGRFMVVEYQINILVIDGEDQHPVAAIDIPSGTFEMYPMDWLKDKMA